jgi:hypothetical protein
MALSGVGDRIMSRQLVELTTAEGCSISHTAAGTMIWAGRVVTIAFLSNNHELLSWLCRCLDQSAVSAPILRCTRSPACLQRRSDHEQ